MATKSKSADDADDQSHAKAPGPEGNPLEGPGIPHVTDATADGTVNNVPNDDESAQQPSNYNAAPEVEGPASSSGADSVAPANYVATDGDVQGDGRSTQDLKDRRVIDPRAPFDYNATLDDTATAQGNLYPPGPDFYRAELARAEQAKSAADQAFKDAKAALTQAQKAHDDNVNEGQNPRTVEAVKTNENSE